MNAEVIVRQATAEDKDFVMATWLKGNFYGSDYWGHMADSAYYSYYGEYVKHTILHPDCRVDIAVLRDDPSLAIGYLVHNNQNIKWAYCKKDFRSKGILNLLLQGKTFLTYGADTKPAHAIAKKKQLTFNPFK